VRTGTALLLALMLGFPVHAQQTLYVDDDTCPSVGNGSDANPFCKIQDAICELRSLAGGGTVLVRPGTYHEAIRMFRDVSVVSTEGAAVTTIDATGKPCLTSSCTVSTLTPCAVVYFGPASTGGASEGDRLQGFTLRDGAGVRTTCGGVCDNVVGGGIFVINASPTITRNTITGNVLNSSTAQVFAGAGIYVGGSTGRPVITANTIEGNVAEPGPGTSSDPSFAWGGGIYVGGHASAWIEGNTIRNNRAGSAAAFVYGDGGGVAISSTPFSPVPIAVVTRNQIQGNTASHAGGGIYFGYNWRAEGPGRSRASDNLIEANSGLEGGGIAVYFHGAEIVNNTIVNNTAGEGGGVRLGWLGWYPTSLRNNLVTGNVASAEGGGLFLEPGSSPGPTITHTDLFGNAPVNVAGDWSEAQFLAQPGNMIADAMYLPGEYRLQQGSPAIDVGLDSVAGALDLDGAPRIQDGDSDGTATVDLGAFEQSTDFDQDGIPDWIDDDDDGDGVLDPEDCADLDPTVQTPPPEVSALTLDGLEPTQLAWAPLGADLHYDVVGGSLLALRLPGAPGAICFVDDLTVNHWTDPNSNPTAGGGFYYLVRAQGGCAGTYGTASSGAPRLITQDCP
jgi:hypothetical protein